MFAIATSLSSKFDKIIGTYNTNTIVYISSKFDTNLPAHTVDTLWESGFYIYWRKKNN